MYNNGKYSELDKQNWKKLYKEGYSLSEIASKYNCRPMNIKYHFDKMNFKLRPRGGVRKYSLNNDFFSGILHEQGAYWLGFILADGCISKIKENTYILAICLHKKDKSHLEKFNKCIQSTYPIYLPKQYNRCDIKICSEKIVKDLINNGVDYRKSLTCVAPDKMLNNKHFWRGVIDGDGSVSIKKRSGRRNGVVHSISLYGTKRMCEQFKEYCEHILGKELSQVRKRKETVYDFSIRAKQARIVIKELYSDCNIYLERKYKIAKEIIALDGTIKIGAPIGNKNRKSV